MPGPRVLCLVAEMADGDIGFVEHGIFRRATNGRVYLSLDGPVLDGPPLEHGALVRREDGRYRLRIAPDKVTDRYQFAPLRLGWRATWVEVDRGDVEQLAEADWPPVVPPRHADDVR